MVNLNLEGRGRFSARQGNFKEKGPYLLRVWKHEPTGFFKKFSWGLVCEWESLQR